MKDLNNRFEEIKKELALIKKKNRLTAADAKRLKILGGELLEQINIIIENSSK